MTSRTVMFEKGSWIWVPDEQDVHLPATVLDSFQMGQAGRVNIEDEEEVELTPKQSAACKVMDEESLGERDDMVKFNDLSEPPLLHNLRKRFDNDRIYTYVGSILVAINPFKRLPLYTLDVLGEYVRSDAGKDCAPHCFAVAARAYSQLVKERASQAICISGESGAGKTESMKLMLQFLAEASGRASGGAEADGNMEQKIIETNPVTEGFGNAKTLRNNNSSRFGKWTAVSMSPAGKIISASITEYLLERSRVAFQMEGERNYHIFYQAFAAAKNPAWGERLQLRDIDDYHYVNQSSAQEVAGIDDAAEFEALISAMTSLNVPETEVQSILQIVAGVIHMGNVNFVGGDESAPDPETQDELDMAAQLLKVNPADLAESFISKNIGTRSVVRMTLDVGQAEDARDAFAKATYGKLFSWLISNKINVGLGHQLDLDAAASSTGRKKTKNQAPTGLVVGVLDIFGFEYFETNSFEQLCINLTNEKLQFHFNEHIFTLEIEVYKSEGIDVGLITFPTNEPTLELLEGKRTGIFAMCDEEVQVGQRGSDQNMLKKINHQHASHPNYQKPGPKQLNGDKCFNVIHYAATVAYNTTNFVAKNRDQLAPGLLEVGQGSDDTVMAALYAPAADVETGRTKSRTRKKLVTLGSSFRSQLNALMDVLASCQPHFVRCVKPNSAKVPENFDSRMVVSQMRCAGLLEVCRIRQVGFPTRIAFNDFFNRYKHLEPLAADHRTLLDACEAKGILDSKGFTCGHSKVFFRTSAKEAIDDALDQTLMGFIVKIQAAMRRALARVQYKGYQAIVEALRQAVAARDLQQIQQCLNDTYQLPYRGRKLPEVTSAQELVVLMEELKKTHAALQTAVRRREADPLRTLIAECEGNADFVQIYAGDLATARQLLHVVEQVPVVQEALVAAMDARDVKRMHTALEQAAELDMDTKETRACEELCTLLEEQEHCRTEMYAALAEKSLTHVNATVQHARELQLPDDDPVMVEALAFCESRKKQLEALNLLQKAMIRATQSRDGEALSAVVSDVRDLVLELGAESQAELDRAVELTDLLVREQELLAAVKAAIDSADHDHVSGVIDDVESYLAHPMHKGAPPPEFAAHLRSAKDRHGRLQKEQQIATAMKQAMVSRDTKSMRKAITAALEFGMADSHPVMIEISELLQSLESEAEAREMAERKAAAEEELRKKRGGMDRALDAAVANEDLITVGRLLDECIAIGYYESAAIESGRALRKREQAREQAQQVLAMALKNADMDVLGSAIAKAEAAEFVGAELLEAKSIYKRLAATDAASRELDQAESADDTEALSSAIEAAAAVGVDQAHVARAQMRLETLSRQQKVLGDLRGALDQDDAESLREALDAASSSLGTGSSTVVTLAQKRLQSLEAANHLQALVADIQDVMDNSLAGASLADYTKLEEALKLAHLADEIDASLLSKSETLLAKMDNTLSTAVDDDYHFSRFPYLRSVEEWSTGILPEARRVAMAKLFLLHQKEPILRSLTKIGDKHVEAMAKLCHREILIFCGDISYSFPVVMAHGLLSRIHACEDDALADEVYLLLCKQLSKNSGHTSSYRAFRLFGLVLRTVPPSMQLKPYLKHFLMVAQQDNDMGFGAMITENLELLEATSRLNIRAQSVMEQREIEASVFKENSMLRAARRASMMGHVSQIQKVKESMDQLELLMQHQVIPMEVRDAVSFATKHPENSQGVEAAWLQLQRYSDAQNLRESFHQLVSDCNADLDSRAGVEEYLIVDMSTHIHSARETPFAGISDQQVDEAENLRAKMQTQHEIKVHLRDAIMQRSTEMLRGATERARSAGFVHLHLYEEAKALLDQLDPSFFDTMWTWSIFSFCVSPAAAPPPRIVAPPPPPPDPRLVREGQSDSAIHWGRSRRGATL